MKKRSNERAAGASKLRRLLLIGISIIVAAALVVTGILCLNPSRRSPANETENGDVETSTTHNITSLTSNKILDLGAKALDGTVRNGDVINMPFCAVLNGRPSGTNAWWKDTQNGYVANSGMYTITLPKGTYTFELWGAQGGNTNNNVTSTHGGGLKPGDSVKPRQAYGGMGAYAKGTLKLTETTTVYIHVGGMGTSDLDNPTTTYRGGGYNGGGGVVNDGNGGGGGGATDVRVVSNNLNNRVLVAGGGGGAGWNGSNPGGYAGGTGNGENGYNTWSGSWWTTSCVGGGATQTRGGYNVSPSTSHSVGSTTGVSSTVAQPGGWGYGGQGAGAHWAGGGGGAGWYGGGGGLVNTGGGGSSYAWSAATKANAPASYAFKSNEKYFLTDTKLLAGNDPQLRGNTGALKNPGASNFAATGGHVCTTWTGGYSPSTTGYGYANDRGNGFARITVNTVNEAPETKDAVVEGGARPTTVLRYILPTGIPLIMIR